MTIALFKGLGTFLQYAFTMVYSSPLPETLAASSLNGSRCPFANAPWKELLVGIKL